MLECKIGSRFRRPALGLGMALVLVAALQGCGGGGPEMARVSGKVSFQGQPLDAGTVSYISTDPNRPNASGAIGPDGSFSLQTREPRDGAQLGEYQVVISDVDPDAMNTALPGEPVELTSNLPAKYQSPTTSGLTRTVERGRNTHDFDLD